MLSWQREGNDNVYAFHSQFYESIAGLDKFASMRKLTKKIDMFAKKALLIPLHLNKNHWALCIVHFTRKKLIYIDSLGLDGKKHLENVFHFMQDDYFAHTNKVWEASEWSKVSLKKQVPQQKNLFDCGVYTILFGNMALFALNIDYNIDLEYLFTKVITQVLKHVNTVRIREQIAVDIISGYVYHQEDLPKILPELKFYYINSE